MVATWAVVLSALVYLCFLFTVAYWGDNWGRRFVQGPARSTIAALALAVYCTSWTFFGSVGLASRSGLDFLTIYVGPVLMIGVGHAVVGRVVRIAKAQNITSIADFIAARYGKAQAVAATVALIAIVGAIPYLALQLKAVSSSLSTILVHIQPASGATQPPWLPPSRAIRVGSTPSWTARQASMKAAVGSPCSTDVPSTSRKTPRTGGRRHSAKRPPG